MDNLKPEWLKSKGYLHLTPQLDIEKNGKEIFKRVTNPSFVAKYAFYPLIHATIEERRYKKINEYERAHSYTTESGEHKRNIKSRPLHYASHLDAIIFGYYATLLQTKYEDYLKTHIGLGDCIIAYRKIEIPNEESNKSTIHFANEVFEEIRKRSAKNKECAVLAFDIKSFFPSLDHNLLKEKWCNIFDFTILPNDHYNVFKASTKFSYILKDDLRTTKGKKRKTGFDEKDLARIRNNFGINCFFDSPKSFRDRVKDGTLKIYKYPFRNKNKEPIGIPQGLPISAVLANMYLLEFDKVIFDFVVKKMGGFYRRYSDDIVVVCGTELMSEIESIVYDSIGNSKLDVSVDKTDKFIYKYLSIGNKPARLTSVKVTKNGEKIGVPLTYLGFEFNGQNILIKSANLAKFYRKMISSVKRKAKRAIKIAKESPEKNEAVIFRRQLYKLYTTRPLNKTKIHKRWKKLIKTDLGTFKLVTGEKSKLLRSNYLTYVTRASTIMNEPAIEKQIKKHKRIFNEAIFRHFTSKKNA